MSDTPETDAKRITHLDVHLQPDGRGRLTGDTNIEVVPADFARQLERERDEARKAPRHDPQWHPLTESKTQFICQRDGMTVSGFVVTSPATGECAIIDKSAVRWLSKDELWWLMHESDSPLNA